MKFPAPVSASWVADLIGAKLVGNSAAEVFGINEIHKVEPGDLVFVDHPKYYEKCLKSAASFVIIDKEVEQRYGKTLMVCAQPFEAYLTIVRHFSSFSPQDKMISDDACIGEGTIIMPGVFLGTKVQVGNNCIIHPNVTIYHNCIIGNNVTIHSGTVIGGDAFYFNTKKNRDVWYKKMESCGRVVIEDDVEIGAGCCIDRGVTHDTRVMQGTKLDNMVHLAHDVVVGKNCLLAAQVGVAGGTTLGNGVALWGQVGINKTIHIGDNAQVMAQSGVAADIEGNKVYWGSPAVDILAKKRELVWVKRIPELWEMLHKKI